MMSDFLVGKLQCFTIYKFYILHIKSDFHIFSLYFFQNFLNMSKLKQESFSPLGNMGKSINSLFNILLKSINNN